MMTISSSIVRLACKILALSLCMTGSSQAQPASEVPSYKVDPYWPKPLPQKMDSEGQLRRWVTGEVGGVCVDSHDHVITMNRGWQKSSLGGLISWEAMAGTPAPPIIIYDQDGTIVTSWGDASQLESGGSAAMPEGFHGCFADDEDNIWIAGNADGVVQKYSHDGALLLQIGTKGICDGPTTLSPEAFFPTCGSPGSNTSETRLNEPADVWVDSQPDPVTNERGSIYVADGYGNHRIIVFDSKGRFLRQWGSAGDGPEQFALRGGGHPHCVAIGSDALVYVCDRGHNRISVFDRQGAFKRHIPINPEGGLSAGLRTNDIEFSVDPQQAYLFTTDAGNAVVQIVRVADAKIVGTIGVGPGRNAGQLVTPHQLAVDSKGNVYIAETISSRRIQRFVKQ